MPIKSYSTTASSNNSAPPNGFPEGMAPASLNDGMRQVMADIRSWYEDPAWIDFGHTPTYVSTTSFTLTGDKTSTYTVGRRIRATGTTPFTIYGTIATSSYSSSTTITVTWDSGTINATLNAVALNLVQASIGKLPSSQITGLTIGTDVQAYDPDLAAIAGITSAADKLPYFTGSGTAGTADFPSYGRSLVATTDAPTARALLGAGTSTVTKATSTALTPTAGGSGSFAHGLGAKPDIYFGYLKCTNTTGAGGAAVGDEIPLGGHGYSTAGFQCYVNDTTNIRWRIPSGGVIYNNVTLTLTSFELYLVGVRFA